jgi:hypothetical protein
MVAISKATLDLAVMDRLFKRQLRWDKTIRYRIAPAVASMSAS